MWCLQHKGPQSTIERQTRTAPVFSVVLWVTWTILMNPSKGSFSCLILRFFLVCDSCENIVNSCLMVRMWMHVCVFYNYLRLYQTTLGFFWPFLILHWPPSPLPHFSKSSHLHSALFLQTINAYGHFMFSWFLPLLYVVYSKLRIWIYIYYINLEVEAKNLWSRGKHMRS